jgi:hypothetical protein
MNTLNYGEYLFQQLLMTRFVQKKLAIILMAIIVNIIQMHIVSVVCYILTVSPIIDFVLHTIISIVCTLNIGITYNAIERYKPEFTRLTTFLINNYSFENYRYWKRILVLGGCGYLCVILWRVEITSMYLFLYILQYGICFIIVDLFEERRIQDWVINWRSRPHVTQDTNDISNLLVESYMSPKANILKNQGRLPPLVIRPMMHFKSK